MLLKEYLKKNGLRVDFFAEKLGIDYGYFRQMLAGLQPFPRKYWEKVITLTKGKVTAADLENNFKGYTRKPR